MVGWTSDGEKSAPHSTGVASRVFDNVPPTTEELEASSYDLTKNFPRDETEVTCLDRIHAHSMYDTDPVVLCDNSKCSRTCLHNGDVWTRDHESTENNDSPLEEAHTETPGSCKLTPPTEGIDLNSTDSCSHLSTPFDHKAKLTGGR